MTREPAARCEVHLRDGPYQGSTFTLPKIEDTLLIADDPLDPATGPIDPADPPVPLAVYELVWESRDPDGDREGTYTYTGHRYPRSGR
jgi:hypothetical protein